MNRFKGLDLVVRVPEVLWMEVHNIVQEALTKTIPKEKKRKRAKWLSKETLQVAETRSERQRERERYTQLNAEFQRVARRDKKRSQVNSANNWRKTIEWERLEISSRELEISREHFMQGWA